MAVSRRRFLHNSALAVIGCAAGPLLAGGPIPKKSGFPSEKTKTRPSTATLMRPAPGRQVFSGVIGASFEVTDHNLPQPVWLRLLSVTDLPALAPVNTAGMAVPPPKNSPTLATKGFILNFAGGPLPNLEQGTYVFQNSSLGQFLLFIVPEGPQQYSAVFSHI